MSNPLSLSLAVFMLAAGAAAQSTLTVPGGFATIQAAIQAASPGDTVEIAPGTYFEHIDFLGKAIRVRGSAGAAATIIDGGGLGTVASFITSETNASILEDVTLMNGLGAIGTAALPGGAGGVECRQSSPTIRRCRIVGNEGGAAFAGNQTLAGAGGVQIASGSPAFTDCVIAQNVGGAASPLAAMGFITAGSQGGPGGVRVTTATPIFRACSITDNVATASASGPGQPGGVAIAGMAGLTPLPARFFSCTIARNHGSAGGQFFVFGSLSGAGAGGAGGIDCLTSMELQSCSITGNVGGASGGTAGPVSAIGGAGGVRCHSVPLFTVCSQVAAVTIFHCTIAANTGGAGDLPGVAGTGGLETNENCVNLSALGLLVWSNTPGAAAAGGTGIASVKTAAGGLKVVSGSLVIAYSDVEGGWPGAGNIDVDPAFASAATGDYHLTVCSPCVDASIPAAGLGVFDVDGGSRLTSLRPDIGADEISSELAGLFGTCEDFELATTAGGPEDPRALVKSASAGSTIIAHSDSPLGTFTGRVPLLAAQLYVDGLPPLSPDGYPMVHLNGFGALVLFDGFAVPGGPFPLPPGGYAVSLAAPATPLPGFTIRLQAFVLSRTALNGIFAASHAHDFLLN
jgi:hypothetical protein